MSLGVRLYQGTPLAKAGLKESLKERFHGNESPYLSEPFFYVSPALGSNPAALVNHYAGDDSRFLLLSEPGQKGSYNYAGDQFLYETILKGARGAYWDILRKAKSNAD